MTNFITFSHLFGGKSGLAFHVNRLLAEDSHEIAILIALIRPQNLKKSSANFMCSIYGYDKKLQNSVFLPVNPLLHRLFLDHDTIFYF